MFSTDKYWKYAREKTQGNLDVCVVTKIWFPNFFTNHDSFFQIYFLTLSELIIGLERRKKIYIIGINNESERDTYMDIMNIWNLNNGLEYQIEIISGISRFENWKRLVETYSSIFGIGAQDMLARRSITRLPRSTRMTTFWVVLSSAEFYLTGFDEISAC